MYSIQNTNPTPSRITFFKSYNLTVFNRLLIVPVAGKQEETPQVMRGKSWVSCLSD